MTETFVPTLPMNACQRLATKPQACYVLQVFERLDLAGGVASKRKGQIIP